MSDVPVPPPLPSDNSVKPQTKIPQWVKILIGICVFLTILLRVLVFNFLPDTQQSGSLIMAVCQPPFWTWLVCVSFQKYRFPAVGWAIAVLLLGLMCFGSLRQLGVIRLGSFGKQREAEQVLTKARERMINLQQRVDNADATDTELLRELQKEKIEVIKSMGTKMGGEMQEVANTIAEVITPMQQENFNLFQEMSEFFSSDTWLVKNLKSKEDVQRGISKLKQWSVRNRKLGEFFPTIEQQLKLAMEKKHFSPRIISATINGFKKSVDMQNTTMAEKFKQDSAVCDAAADVLILFEERWGDWHLADGQVVWDKQDGLNEFHRRNKTLVEAFQKQERATQEAQKQQLETIKSVGN